MLKSTQSGRTLEQFTRGYINLSANIVTKRLKEKPTQQRAQNMATNVRE
jgi:hypothetical protein